MKSTTFSTANAIDHKNVDWLRKNSTNISGTAENLRQHLKSIEEELRQDKKGKKEYDDFLTKLNMQKADLQQRVQKNTAWIANFEREQEGGAFEKQYKQLVDEIQVIYDGAKEFHNKGIDMLIQEFQYHIAYKRWNDTFTASPFKPK